MMSTIEIIDWNTKIFTKKIIITLIFEIDNNSIHIRIALIN